MKSNKRGLSPKALLLLMTALLCTLLLSSCLVTDGLLKDPNSSEGSHVCSFTQRVEKEKYMISEASCTSPGVYCFSCTCGKAGANTFYTASKEHECVNEIATKKYLVSEATMNSPALYGKSCDCGYGGSDTFEYGGRLLVANGKKYKPTSVTVTLYDTAESVYGFTYNSELEPIEPVIQIKMMGATGWSSYTATSEQVSSYNSDDSTYSFYVSKAEIELMPNTAYVYRICDEGAGICTSEMSLITADASAGAFTFVHASDSQEGVTEFGRVLSAVLGRADFIIHTGDVVQNTKYEDEWYEMLEGNSELVSSIPIMAISGNHETTYSTHGSYETDKHFNNNIPEQTTTRLGYYYSFIYGSVKFIMLNTNDLTGNQLKPEQYDWLIEELTSNTATWTIVAMHNPLYSVGKYGANPDRNAIALALREQLQGIFADYGVDLVLQAHDHAISRTYPIDENGVPQIENTVTVDGVEYIVDPDGVIYVMNGPAGSQTRSPYAIDESLYAYAEKSKKASWAEIEVTGDTVTVTVKWHDGTAEGVYHKWGIQKTDVE